MLRHERAVLAVLLTLFLCRATLASVIVPPWQGPDEPDHFLLAHAQYLGQSLADARPALEREVVASMAKYRWWEPYGKPTPVPLPTAFSGIPDLGRGTYSQPVYYGLGAAVLRVTRPSSVEDAYWDLRRMSTVLGMLTLVFGWCGTRLLFGPVVAAGATAIAALNPQFLLFSMTVNPDALAAVLGAFIWWQLARAVRGHRPGLSLVFIIVAVATLPITKRSAVPMGAVALVIVGLLMAGVSTLRLTRRAVVAVLATVALAGAAAAVVALTLEGAALEFVTRWTDLLEIRRPIGMTMVPEALAYVRESIDGVWLIAGWLRFEAPGPWVWVARSLTIAGFAGALLLLFRRRMFQLPLSIGAAFVIAQAVGVLAWGFLAMATPQGRYQFPVMAPATALLWLGLTYAAPARFQPYAAPALVAVLAIMDVTAFTTVLMPAYLPWT